MPSRYSQPTQLSQPEPARKKRKRMSQYDRSHRPGKISNGLGYAFPQKYTAKLLYFDTITATVDSATLLQQFSVNSLYDPDISGIGHQPRGFDQLCTTDGPYGRYLVTDCLLECWPSVNVPGFITLCASNVSLSGLTLATLAESNGTAKIDYAPTVAYARGQVFKIRVKPWQLVGVTKAEYMGDYGRFGGDYGTSPSEVMNIGIKWDSYDQTTQFADFSMLVRITYTAEFSDSRLLPSS